jgi:hypothetical protein
VTIVFFFQEKKPFGALPFALILCQYVTDITCGTGIKAEKRDIGQINELYTSYFIKYQYTSKNIPVKLTAF